MAKSSPQQINKICPSGQCVLETLSASQISSLLVFIIYLSIEFYTALYQSKTYYLEIMFASILTLINFFLGSWLAEEDWVFDLRTLKKIKFFRRETYFLSHLQWWIRVFTLLLLGLYTTITNEIVAKLFKLNDIALSTLIFLGFVYFAFIIWDIIIVIGGQGKLIQKYFVYDSIGLIFLIAVIVTYSLQLKYWTEAALYLFIVGSVGYAGYIVVNLKALKRLGRISKLR